MQSHETWPECYEDLQRGYQKALQDEIFLLRVALGRERRQRERAHRALCLASGTSALLAGILLWLGVGIAMGWF